MRALLVAAALGAVAFPLAAQSPATEGQPVRAPAVLPAGWAARFDRASADPSKAVVVPMGDGIHFTTGPSATYYHADLLDGEYAVEATFAQAKAPAHPESYGLMAMGRALDSPTQNYFYFMVRGDGTWALKHRASDTEVHTVQDFVAHAAVNKADAAGKASNALRIAVGTDSVRFQVNGQTLQAMSRQYLTDVSGRAGIRMNHGLDVHVGGYRVVQAAAPAK